MSNTRARVSRVPRITATVAIAIGLLTQAGWWLDLQVIKQPFPSASPMMATTATAFVAVGVGLWLLSVRRFPFAVGVIGVGVTMIGLLSLEHIAYAPDFVLDRLWLIDHIQLNRMSPLTALCFSFLGPAIVLSTRANRAAAAQALALTSALVAVVVCIGYLYEVSELVGVGMYTTMAPHTAVLLLAVCTGLLYLEPDAGLMGVMTGNTLGGKMARRTLPATIGIPIALGWLRLAGERAGFYDARVGPPIVVLGSMVLISIVIWLNARQLANVDAQRQHAQEELRRANEVLEERVAQKTAEAAEKGERLRAAERMEAMGQLAGGIAHDFNNMMTVVSGYSEMLLDQLNAEDPARKTVLEIKKAGDRCTKLTSHLLAFSRGQMFSPTALSLDAIVADLCGMLPVLVGEDIAIESRTGQDLWTVEADEAQIEQVIVNLAVNARDAMPRGGTLSIETRNVDASKDPASGIPPGRYVVLSVSDTGHGMDEETRLQAFDPFFTTKPVGQGTGLGLSTVYGIVKQSHGHVSLESTPGTGTTVRIYLPSAARSAKAATPTERRPAPTGGETVLLVEDEEAVRHYLRRVLERGGYVVLDAADARQALDICQQRAADPIHLLLTDVVMPSMSGGELAQRIKALRPDTMVLFISGYAEDVLVHYAVTTARAAVLQKPFTSDTLLTRVREVLDTSPEARAAR